MQASFPNGTWEIQDLIARKLLEIEPRPSTDRAMQSEQIGSASCFAGWKWCCGRVMPARHKRHYKRPYPLDSS